MPTWNEQRQICKGRVGMTEEIRKPQQRRWKDLVGDEAKNQPGTPEQFCLYLKDYWKPLKKEALSVSLLLFF